MPVKFSKRLLLWALLALGAVSAVALLRALAIPGAVLLGPMLVAMVFALSGAELRLKPAVLLPVQAVLGCMVASVISLDLLHVLADHWLVVLAVNLLSIGAASLIAMAITRRGWLPGQSAIWGLSPGAASMMMMLGEQRGEDPRLIAMMQQLRIVLVTLVAIGVAALAGTGGGSGAHASLFAQGPPTLNAMGVLVMLVIAGTASAMTLKWAQAAFWIPVMGGSVLQLTQLARVEVPALLAAIAFGMGGCYAGLRFNKQAVLACLRLMPAMLLGIALLIAACIALMWPIQHSFHSINALTAFLAIMPGGIDAAVAVAHGMNASVPVIIAVQVTRLIVVSLLAPLIAQVVASHCAPRPQ